MNKRALIFGVTGQDGFYLSQLLLKQGYTVVGTSRDSSKIGTHLQKLIDSGRINVVSAAPSDYRSVQNVIANFRPKEIYNLSGQTSVGLSYDQPVETIESIVTATLNILESIKFLDPEISFYNAGSSECFGDTSGFKASEDSPFKPLSPYAVAKAASANLVASYRISYGLKACTGFLFNHESPLRPSKFVTQKIVQSAALIKMDKLDFLRLGNININRDWGWAPEYVDAMQRMLQLDEPEDFIIATGKTVPLSHFIEAAFSFFNLDWHNYVESEDYLSRPSDISYSAGDPSKAKRLLSWEAKFSVDDVVDEMCSAIVVRNSNLT
jgi:GDPmannose 4,6-dehydratase